MPGQQSSTVDGGANAGERAAGLPRLHRHRPPPRCDQHPAHNAPPRPTGESGVDRHRSTIEHCCSGIAFCRSTIEHCRSGSGAMLAAA